MKVIENDNYKSLFIFLAILFICTIAINGVAGANFTVATNGDDGQDGSYATPFKTLSHAIDEIEDKGDIQNNITFMNGTYTHTNNGVTGITIYNNVNIYSAKYLGYSNEDTILDGENEDYFFNIDDGVNVNIYGIKFQNGMSEDTGGIISCGNLNLKNVSFENCKNNNSGEDYKPGGALLIFDGILNLDGCNFINNSAIGGGAIFIEEGSVNISNSTFIDNKATDVAGAIYSKVRITLDSCNFTNNSAISAGALYIKSGISNSNVIDCNFTNNSAIDVGGALFIDGGAVTVRNSTFNNNNLPSIGNLKQGEFIYAQNSVINLNNCNFTNGTANRGGAIFISNSNVDVVDCIFEDNTAIVGGGAIFMVNCINIKINNSTFTKNIARKEESFAGAIYIDGGSVTIIDSNFTNNEANITAGAIFIRNCVAASLVDCIFENNTAINRGGAIDIESDNVNINNCSFIKNEVLGSKSYGGAISINGINNKINGSTFIENFASAVGGAIMVWGGIVEVNGSNFTDNSVSEDLGSAIFVSGGLCTVYYSYFKDSYDEKVYNDINGSLIANNNEGISNIESIRDNTNNNNNQGGTTNTQSGSKLATSITPNFSSSTGIFGKPVVLSATLKDSKGNLLAYKNVDVLINGVRVATVTTNGRGIATYSYNVKKTGNLAVSFRHNGDAGYVGSISRSVNLTVKKHSIVQIKNIAKKSKGTSVMTSTIKNTGPDKLTGKVTYKFAKGLNIAKVSAKLGKYTINKKKGTITFNLKNFKKGSKLAKLTVTFNSIVKGKKYVTNKVTSTNTLTVKRSNK